MRPGFLLRIALPVALGVFLALWVAQGDTSPMADDVFEATSTLKEEDSVSFQNLRVVQVRFADGTAVDVMGSSVVPFMRYLLDHDTQKVAWQIRPRVIQKLER